MPKRKKGKKKKPARSAAAKSMLKKSDFYPDMGPIIKSFDEREKTRAKGPEELPHGSLDIPLWLAYYDELYVLNKGSGGKGMMEARDYLEKVVPSQKYLPAQLRIKTSKEGRREAVRSRQPLPVPSKERQRAATERVDAMAEEGGPASLASSEKNDWMPAWFNLDEAKKSFSSGVDTGKFQSWLTHSSPVRLSPTESSGRPEYSATVKAMTERHPKK